MTYTKFEYFGAVIAKRALEMNYDHYRNIEVQIEDAAFELDAAACKEMLEHAKSVHVQAERVYLEIEDLNAKLFETRCNVPRETIEEWRTEFNEATRDSLDLTKLFHLGVK